MFGLGINIGIGIGGGRGVRWPLAIASVDMDFPRNRYFASGGLQTLASLLTITRTTIGWAEYVDGHWAQFASGAARLTDKGLLVEEGRVNVALWNRDITNAAWTKTDTTAAKDQTGIDGVANSASKITASAANGTALQAITLASSARSQSAFVKRITGTGAVQMTMDGGTTWTAITVTSDWTKVTIPSQTLANPNVGFRLVTSGDAIAVDMVQNENGAYSTSPIPTTTAAVTRNTDTIRFTNAGLFSLVEGTMFAEWTEVVGPVSVVGNVSVMRVDGSNLTKIQRTAANRVEGLVSVANVAQASLVSVNNVVAGLRYRAAFGFKQNDFALAASQDLEGALLTDTSGDVPTGAFQLWLGSSNGGNALNGYLRRFAWATTRVSDSALSVWGWASLGSLTAGDEAFDPGALVSAGEDGDTIEVTY